MKKKKRTDDLEADIFAISIFNPLSSFSMCECECMCLNTDGVNFKC